MKNRVKIIRIERSLSQVDLAAKMGVSRQTIHAIETGKYVPSTVLALKLIDLLGARLEDLFELEKEDWS